MTKPGDIDTKNQRKVLTVKGSVRDPDAQKKTLTIKKAQPQKVSTYHGSTVIVINKKATVETSDQEKLGTLTTEEKNSRLNALKVSKEAFITKESKSEVSQKADNHQSIAFDRPDKRKIKEIISKPKIAVEKDEVKETAVEVVEDKPQEVKHKQEATKPKYVRPIPVVDFNSDTKKKFKDLNLRDKKDKPQEEVKILAPEVLKTITTASSIKQIESNKKKVTHSKSKTFSDDESVNVSSHKNKPKAHLRISAAHIAKIESGDTESLFRSNIIRKKKKNKTQDTVQDRVLRSITISNPLTVSDLANKISEKGVTVVKALMKLGVMATINQVIDPDTAELIATDLGHKVQRVTEDSVIQNLIGEYDEVDSKLETRPPVVTIMGHVDHGKTSLLDALRKTDVAAGEHGGITQHIGAYEVHLPDGQSITFLDTPGHEAFSAMRMRGAKVTDIIILVVAADDGIKAQTVEAISHAKAAKVPIIVAINKMDKQGANFDLVKQSLLQHDIIPDDFGGDVMVIGIAALTGLGLDNLIEAILLQSELLNLKSPAIGRARGYIIEARLDKIKGFTASLLVQSGELKVGDIIVAGHVFGRIRTLSNDKGKAIKIAGPSMPVEVTGLDSVPVAGDEFIVMQNEKSARDLVEMLQLKVNEQKLLGKIGKPKSLQELFVQSHDNIKEIPIIVKADVHGSAEAILHSLNKIIHPEIKVNILHYGAGSINESDVMLAAASKALILGFNIRPNVNAKEMASKMGVEMKFYSVIYHLIDDVKAIISNALTPTERENTIGLAEIRKVFETSKFGKISGCYIKEGMVKRNCSVRVIRDSAVVHTGSIQSLKRQKDDIKEVKEGFECGITLANFDDIRVGDHIEAFEVIIEKKTL
jgi:translation initiation factor IF-2